MGLTTLPFFVYGMWGTYIDILFGSYTGLLSIVPMQILARRATSIIYNRNPNSKYVSKLILSIRLINKTHLEVEYYDTFRTLVNLIILI